MWRGEGCCAGNRPRAQTIDCPSALSSPIVYRFEVRALHLDYVKCYVTGRAVSNTSKKEVSKTFSMARHAMTGMSCEEFAELVKSVFDSAVDWCRSAAVL